MTPPATSSPHLVGPRVKIARARQHFVELQGAVLEWSRAAPVRVHEHDDRVSGELFYWVEVAHDVPIAWGAAIGDVVHNLRSALDLLAWQLVLENGATPGRATYFPVAIDHARFTKTLKESLDGASATAARVVRRLRPYSGGNPLLAGLHELDIVDKHRLIVAVAAANTFVEIGLQMPALDGPGDAVQFPEIRLALRPADTQYPLRTGAVLYKVLAQARTEPSSERPPRFGVDVVVHAGTALDGRPVIELLAELADHVERVVNLFGRVIFGEARW